MGPWRRAQESQRPGTFEFVVRDFAGADAGMGTGAGFAFADVFTAGRADAALAASGFHFSEHAVAELKGYLLGRGIPVRC